MNIASLHKIFLQQSGLSTDTRKLKPGQLFFALSGENFNGNEFARQALEKGASFAVIDQSYQTVEGKTILVSNVLETLQELATYHRNYLGIPIIALTGSNGKTTTKELLQAVLSQQFKTVAILGNLNNHIGVPLTLLSMTENSEIGIVEMGANHPGEIAALCEIAQPDYGYITNFGKAHLEGFGSLEGVIQAKTELYRYLKKHQKTLFINADDPVQQRESSGAKTYRFGTDTEVDLSISSQTVNPFATVRFGSTVVGSQLIGLYNTGNIAAAIAVGKYFHLSDEQIKAGIESYQPQNNRSQLVQKGPHHILLDAYNANPTSMQAALTNFEQLQVPEKVVILGDMFEVGPNSRQEHQLLATQLENSPFDKVFLIGQRFLETTGVNDKVARFEAFEAFQETFSKQIGQFRRAYFLVKGSRGMALERVLELF